MAIILLPPFFASEDKTKPADLSNIYLQLTPLNDLAIKSMGDKPVTGLSTNREGQGFAISINGPLICVNDKGSSETRALNDSPRLYIRTFQRKEKEQRFGFEAVSHESFQPMINLGTRTATINATKSSSRIMP